jgi:acetyl-CoA carboxylase biotin carboxyl carrier protein
MANGGSGSGEVFDVRKVRRFVELMNEHDLSEVDLRQGDQRIRLRRGQDPVVAVGAPQVAAPPVAAAPPAAAPAAASAAGDAGEDDPNTTYVTSPMVGTFYVASSPESPALVKVGDHVGPDTTVCIIEAMKVFNEIPAECSGTIAALLVSNGDSVEFGQKLFKVTKA